MRCHIHQYVPKFNMTWNLKPILSSTKTYKSYKTYTFIFKVDTNSVKEVKGYKVPDYFASDIADADIYKVATEKELKKVKEIIQKAKDKAAADKEAEKEKSDDKKSDDSKGTDKKSDTKEADKKSDDTKDADKKSEEKAKKADS